MNPLTNEKPPELAGTEGTEYESLTPILTTVDSRMQGVDEDSFQKLLNQYHPAIVELQRLGYRTGDQVWLRLLLPKKMPQQDALKRGLAFKPDPKNEPKKIVPIPIDGYLTLNGDRATFTRVYKVSGRTRLEPNGLGYLRDLNNKGYGVYLVVNPGGRSDEEITECRSLFYEVDDLSKDEQWTALRRLEAKISAEASLVVETAKSLHVYFMLMQGLQNAEWMTYQQRLIQEQKSDRAIHNPSRLMRLSGFDHQKWDDENKQLISTPINNVQVRRGAIDIAAFDAVLPQWDESFWNPGAAKARAREAGENWQTIDFNAPHVERKPSSNSRELGFDMRDFAHYLDHFVESGRRGWDTCQCPVHGRDGTDHSNDSLHISHSTGSYVCHTRKAECNPKAIWKAALEIAKSRGFTPPDYREINRGQVKKLNKLTSADSSIARQINERYIPDTLPVPIGEKLVVIASAKGTGKTRYLSRIAAQTFNESRKVLSLVHRQSLVEAMSKVLGIESIYDTKGKGEDAGRSRDVAQALGLAQCVNSMRGKKFDPNAWRNATIILDEFMQVLFHALDNDTCQAHRVEILQCLNTVINNALSPETAGCVVISDADVSDVGIEFVKNISGRTDLKPWVLLNTYKLDGFTAYNYENFKDDSGRTVKGNDHWLTCLSKSIEAGEKNVVLTTAKGRKSRFSTVNLERYFKNKYPDKTVIVIDGDTTKQLDHPAFGCFDDGGEYFTTLLTTHDIVIMTSVVETGLSIDIKGYFNNVFGYFGGNLEANSVRQMLARVRESIPRHVFIAERGTGHGETDAKKIIEQTKTVSNSNLHQIFKAAIEEGAINTTFLDAAITAWATLTAKKNLESKEYRKTVLDGLENEGYIVLPAHDIDCQEVREIGREATDNKNESEEEDAIAIQEEELISEQVRDERSKSTTVASEKERRENRKRYLFDQYMVEPTAELHKKDLDGYKRQLQRQYYLSIGKEYLQARDRAVIESLTFNKVAWCPDIAKKCLGGEIWALQLINVLTLLEHDEIKSTDEWLIAWAEGVKNHADEIKIFLGITINPKHSPIQVASSILRKLGLKPQLDRKEGGRGKQVRVYTIDGLDDGRIDIFSQWKVRDKNVSANTVVSDSNSSIIDAHDYSSLVNQLVEWAERAAEFFRVEVVEGAIATIRSIVDDSLFSAPTSELCLAD